MPFFTYKGSNLWCKADLARAKYEEKAGKPFTISSTLRQIAWHCSRAFGIELFGFDVIFSEGRPYVVDINCFPGFKGVPNASSLLAGHIEKCALGHRNINFTTRRLISSLSDELQKYYILVCQLVRDSASHCNQANLSFLAILSLISKGSPIETQYVKDSSHHFYNFEPYHLDTFQSYHRKCYRTGHETQ
jgi:inositol 1,3,4-trisphosphate 5/6-kinase